MSLGRVSLRDHPQLDTYLFRNPSGRLERESLEAGSTLSRDPAVQLLGVNYGEWPQVHSPVFRLLPPLPRQTSNSNAFPSRLLPLSGQLDLLCGFPPPRLATSHSPPASTKVLAGAVVSRADVWRGSPFGCEVRLLPGRRTLHPTKISPTPKRKKKRLPSHNKSHHRPIPPQPTTNNKFHNG